jgi:hypothetical protein
MTVLIFSMNLLCSARVMSLNLITLYLVVILRNEFFLHYDSNNKGKGKGTPVEVQIGPEGSRMFRLPGF